MRGFRKYLNVSIDEVFPTYKFKSRGAYSYDWWKDGNKLGGKKASKMTLKLNKLMIHGIRVY